MDTINNSKSTISVRGLYINLSNSTERKRQCEDFISNFDLSGYYSRFPGVDGKQVYKYYKSSGLSPGQIGCWISHMEAIKKSFEHEYHVHLLEDDFELTSAFPQFLQNFDEATSRIDDWDIIFTDLLPTNMYNAFFIKKIIYMVDNLQNQKRCIIENARDLYAACASSYIVNKKNKKKVADIIEKGLAISKLPIDIYFREEARKGNLKIYVTLPFLTTLNENFMKSDILGKIDHHNPSIINDAIFRKSLSWGADTKSLLSTINRRIDQQKSISDRMMIYANLVAHLVSDEYQNY